jgi:hypothetical protein
LSKYRKDARIDANQPEIVAQLEAAGCTVDLNRDDILVGYKGETLWVEIKTPETFKKTGFLKAGTFKDSQINLIKNWNGRYGVAWYAEQILHELGVKCG